MVRGPQDGGEAVGLPPRRKTGWPVKIGAVVAIFVLSAFAPFPQAVANAKPPGQRAFLILKLNGTDHGQIVVVIRKNDILAPVATLRLAGLRSIAGRQETLWGKRYVSLSSLAPNVTYKFDQRNLVLALTARAKLFKPHDINLSVGRPPDLKYRSDLSTFVNYSFDVNNFTEWDGFFEGGVSFHRALLYSALTRTSLGSFVRGLTNLTYDDPANMRRWMLGDTFVNTGVLGSGAFLGGFSVAKDFGLDPYFIRYPTQTISGALTAPATVDVYRNGLLIKQEQLPPGQFSLYNIPGVVGLSNTRVVIRDVFGGVREITQPYYMASGLLEPGLNDYGYGIGLVRNYLGYSSWRYGPLAFSAYHRVGLSSWLTAGFRFEAERDFQSGGPTLAVKLPLGETDMALALSRSHGQGGGAGSLSYQFLLSGGYAFGFQTQWMSPHYATLNLRPSDNRPIISSDAFASFNLGSRTSLNLDYVYQRYRDDLGSGTITHDVSASAIIRLSEALNLSINVTRALPENSQPVNEVFFALSYLFGQNSVATASYDHRSGDDLGSLSVQKPLPLGPGYGYMLQAQNGTHEQENGIFQYQNNYGTYQGNFIRSDGDNSGSMTLAGGIVGIGRRLFLTRPIQNGFALIRVPGVSNVRCYWSNQVIGHTDHNGDCLLPNLLPYYGNKLGISQNDIPIDYSVQSVEKTVAVPYRGGALIDFPVHKIQQLVGKVAVIDHGKRIVPAYGEFTMLAGGLRASSPVGEHGEFYFQDVPPGSYKARVDFTGGTCRFTVGVPKAKKMTIRMGTLTCKVRPGA